MARNFQQSARSLAGLLCLLLGLCGSAEAQLDRPRTAADSAITRLFAPPDLDDFERLIDDLHEPDPEVRDRAAASLLGMGDGVIPLLEELRAEDELAPEAAFQVESVLERLRGYVPADLKRQLGGVLGLDADILDSFDLLSVDDKLQLVQVIESLKITSAAGLFYRHFRLEQDLDLVVAYIRALRLLDAQMVFAELAAHLRGLPQPEDRASRVWLSSRLELIELEMLLGQPEAALLVIESCRDVLVAAEEFRVDEQLQVSLFLRQAEVLTLLGRVDEALEPLDALAARYPDQPGFALQAGQILLAQGREEEALERFKAARAIFMDATDEQGFRYAGLRDLVGVFLSMRLFDEALETIEAIESLLLFDLEVRVLRAQYLHATEQYEEGMRVALAVFPQTEVGSTLHETLKALIPQLMRALDLDHLAEPEFLASLYDGPSLKTRLYATLELVERRLDDLAQLEIERLFFIAPRSELVYEWAIQLQLNRASLSGADEVLARAEKHLQGRQLRALRARVEAARATLEAEGGRSTAFFGRWLFQRNLPSVPEFAERSDWPAMQLFDSELVAADSNLLGVIALQPASGALAWSWQPELVAELSPSSDDEVLGAVVGGLVQDDGELWVGTSVYSYEPRRPSHSNKCVGLQLTRLQQGMVAETRFLPGAPAWTGEGLLLEDGLLVYTSKLRQYRQLVGVSLAEPRLLFTHRFRADAVFGPFAAKQRLVLVTQLGLVVVFDLQGNELSRLKTGTALGAVLMGEQLVVFHREQVECLDLSNDTQLWQVALTDYLVGTPAVCAGRVWGNMADGSLVAWNLADGSEGFRLALPRAGARDIYALDEERCAVVNERPEASGLGSVVRVIDGEGKVLWRDAAELRSRLSPAGGQLFFQSTRKGSHFKISGLLPNLDQELSPEAYAQRLLAGARAAGSLAARLYLYRLALKECPDQGAVIYLDLVETLLRNREPSRARAYLDEGRMAHPSDPGLRSKDLQLAEEEARRRAEEELRNVPQPNE